MKIYCTICKKLLNKRSKDNKMKLEYERKVIGSFCKVCAALIRIRAKNEQNNNKG